MTVSATFCPSAVFVAWHVYTPTIHPPLPSPPLPSPPLPYPPLPITHHKLTQNTQCDRIGYILSQRCVRSLTRIHPHHPPSPPLPSNPLPSPPLTYPSPLHNTNLHKTLSVTVSATFCPSAVFVAWHVYTPTIHPPLPSPPLPSPTPPHYTPQTYTKHSVWLYRLHFVQAPCS